MIGALTGTPLKRTEKYILLDVGGVGYKVFATLDTIEFAASSNNVFLLIHTVVREDVLELYGFRDEVSLDMFERLIGISGIGPRSALGVLSVADPETLKSAIINGDISYLTKVSGIGKKTAEKILLELRDVLGKGVSVTNGSMTDDTEVMLALESLGYSTSEARATLQYINPETIGTNNKIKEALKALSK
jgi:holliday junction DNA helicase RuvA